jgi:formylglycine-generating enzyme required for sulfatase activity
MKSNWVKGILTVVGAVLFSTLGIFAADSMQGIKGGIQNFAGVKGAGVCNEGSVPLKIDTGIICVDMYEASPSEKCPHRQLTNAIQSEQNANTADCYAATVKSTLPWSYISLSQAQRMCAGAGKRLPTSEEWYHIALATNPDACTINASAVANTGNEACVSSIGAYDTVGNVWEWVDENVVGSTVNGRQLPKEGYVTSVDAGGVAITSGENADDMYGKDYFWSKDEGVFGMIRGGFYGSNQDAGLYTVNASVPTTFATQGVGFRCVKDVL